jgi:hypothetical protein
MQLEGLEGERLPSSLFSLASASVAGAGEREK